MSEGDCVQWLSLWPTYATGLLLGYVANLCTFIFPLLHWAQATDPLMCFPATAFQTFLFFSTPTPFLPPLLFSAQRRMMVYKDTSDCVQTKLISLFSSLPKSIPLPGISFLRSLCSSIFLGLGLQIQIRGDCFRPGTASARPLTSLLPILKIGVFVF